jgi:hypothetical protein
VSSGRPALQLGDQGLEDLDLGGGEGDVSALVRAAVAGLDQLHDGGRGARDPGDPDRASAPAAAGMLDGMMWDYMRRMPMRRPAPALNQPDLFNPVSA